jgi:DNA polymerase-3 subunit beta
MIGYPYAIKFSVSKNKLLEGLSTVKNVVSTRTTLPLLSNVLLQANEREIRLTLTDLDVGIRRSVDAQVERTGATTLPAWRLLSIGRELPSSEIYFDVDAKNLASIIKPGDKLEVHAAGKQLALKVTVAGAT